MPDIRFITDDEVPAFHQAIPFGFGDDLTVEEGSNERFRDLFNNNTCIGAFEGDRVVATFGSFDFDVTIPGGGALAMAGTTVVTVQPTHRRQGVLTTMMRMHLDQAIERGQPVAGLWASETPIYGRFGYGQAAHSIDLTVPTDRVTLPAGPASDTVRLIDADDACDVLPPIYDKVRRTIPGMLSRSDAWWKHRRLRDAESMREGASSRRIAVAYRDGEPVGYVAYRQKEKWEGMISDGTVEVIEVVPLDEDARRTLWHYLASIDLFPNVHWWNAPADYPLLVEADNIRRVTTKPFDSLWLRILDIPTTLTARTYETDGAITMHITDDYLGRGGTYRLDITDGTATCTETTDDPDVTLSIADLGALYLGRPAALPLWRAGAIEGDYRSDPHPGPPPPHRRTPLLQRDVLARPSLTSSMWRGELSQRISLWCD